MTSSTFLSRSIDYLGNLGAKLRDLQGYGTLAHELIQNADDAPASWMSFDIRQDSLVLDNDGVFSSCEDIEAPECLRRTNDGAHRCDFHRFRLIGSGDKRLQEGTTGAFGIGFISVYQLTDQPELISAGRHWTLHEERSEAERIKVCQGCAECSKPDLPGTRFIFPFARDEETLLRRALKAEPVPENVAERLLEELERSLPVAMLFLKNLSEIGIRYEGSSRRTFERVVDDNMLIISEGDSTDDRVWHLLRGTFEDAAAELRARHPARIEDKRSAEVVVAVPIQGELSAGMLCACLPTEESTGLPFHVNADFFPSNDRKHVILGEDYQSQWNREALSAAARTVARAVPQLTTMLGAERFWDLAFTLNTLYLNVNRDGRDGVWREFWTALEVVLQEEAVVFTSNGNWTTTHSGVTILSQQQEADHISVLEGLGIELVAENLRPYQSTIRSIGVPLFNVETLCSTFKANELDNPVRFDDLPPCLTLETGRSALWSEIAILLGRQGSTPNAKRADEERLGGVSLAPVIDDALWPCERAFRADASTVGLFSSLGIDIPFLDQEESAFEPLENLCPEFAVEDAVQALEEANPATIQRLWQEGRFSLPKLIEWFDSRRWQIVDVEDLRHRLAALPIYPGADHLHPLSSLDLPGTFEDPLGLATLVDVAALGGRKEFLRDLRATELTFGIYVLRHLSLALDDETLDPGIRRAAVGLLADHLGELMDDDEVRQRLSSVRLVSCTDGKYRPAHDCYFASAVISAVLGDDANVALLPETRGASVRRLLDWIGVASVPRLGDIIRTIRRIAEAPCSASAVSRMQGIFAHLVGRFEHLEGMVELETLRNLEWLPARGDTSKWHQPGSLYAPYQSYLFDSQVEVLNVPPSTNRDLLDFLGVHTNPAPSLVVRHLLHCAERSVPVNREVYRFLNDNVDDLSIERLRSTKCLWLGDAYSSPEQCFWGSHPFGQYRWRLDGHIRDQSRLLAKIGVTDSPDHEDALDVLREISAEFGEANRPLHNDAYAVVMSCWRMIERALNDDAISNGKLHGALGQAKCIPNENRVMYLPTLLFFENRVGLAAKFEVFLASHVIPRQLGTGGAFLAAGVKQLGSAVATELLRTDNPDVEHDTMERLRQRRGEIARVLSGQMASDQVQGALGRLSSLHCMSATSLEIRYRLEAFGRVLRSQPELASAAYHSTEHSLWSTHSNGQVPLAPLARELAIALCPEEDPGLFAAGLKEVLSASTTAEAATVLDELGFPQLDANVVEPLPVSEAAHQLGIEVPISHLESPPHEVRDGSQSDTTARGETETSTESDPRGSEAASRHRGREFVSYVAVSPAEGDEPETDGLTHQERMNLEDKAIELIIGQEPELRRTPKNNPGFDLTELGPDGEPVKWVEVKAMKGTLLDHPVGLSRTQFEWAQKHGSLYWLYVVERAGDPEHAQVVRIQDPAGKARTFTFDHGWVAVAEDINGTNPQIRED